jgi:hypothetical protein
VDEATIILAASKARKVQHHSFQNKGRERNYSKLPFAAEGFGIFFGRGDFLGRVWGGCGRAASPSKADAPESNKFSTWAKARVILLPPAVVEDAFYQQS